MREDDWKPHLSDEHSFADKSDEWLVLLLGDNLQHAILRMAAYAAAVAAVIATLARFLL